MCLLRSGNLSTSAAFIFHYLYLHIYICEQAVDMDKVKVRSQLAGGQRRVCSVYDQAMSVKRVAAFGLHRMRPCAKARGCIERLEAAEKPAAQTYSNIQRRLTSPSVLTTLMSMI